MSEIESGDNGFELVQIHAIETYTTQLYVDARYDVSAVPDVLQAAKFDETISLLRAFGAIDGTAARRLQTELAEKLADDEFHRELIRRALPRVIAKLALSPTAKLRKNP